MGEGGGVGGGRGGAGGGDGGAGGDVGYSGQPWVPIARVPISSAVLVQQWSEEGRCCAQRLLATCCGRVPFAVVSTAG
jgi:hypothetical protein